uniref:Uncharacterized protein n=1 Tax=Octopus bimaculoides TaxID=37653 RepID=A0A0L8HE50_OCTBM
MARSFITFVLFNLVCFIVGMICICIDSILFSELPSTHFLFSICQFAEIIQ